MKALVDEQVKCTNATAAEASAELLSCLPSSPVTQALSEDVQSLMCQFLDVSGTYAESSVHLLLCTMCSFYGIRYAGFEAVDASISVVTATSCPRFHADHVELRCLCTYFGEGTYYVPNAAVDRRKWMRALGIQDTNGFGVKSERFIQQASEWDVVILKGNAFPGNEGQLCVNIGKPCLYISSFLKRSCRCLGRKASHIHLAADEQSTISTIASSAMCVHNCLQHHAHLMM